jgi:hypothetical protein
MFAVVRLSAGLFVVFSCFTSLNSYAVLKPTEVMAANMASLDVPGRVPELCIALKHFPTAKYSSKDERKEAELCSLNVNQNVAACGKMTSTNPGVLFSTSKTQSLEELTRTNCSNDDAKTQGKYKLSTSCSYTPSILAYYHLSRLLGNIGNVPVSVLRTFDIDRHKEVAQRTLKLLPRDEIIYQTWSSLNSALEAGPKGKKADLLFVEGFQQTYGALLKNVKNDGMYKEFFNGGKDRAATFRERNVLYKSLTRREMEVPRDFNFDNMQKFVQMRDISEFILLDYILSQQDRFGNIDYRESYYYLTVDNNGQPEVESDPDLEDVPEEARAGALKIKEMVLNDNDCGVVKTNVVKDAKLLEGIAHIDPKTYRRLMDLAALVDQPEIKTQFLSAVQFTEKDFMNVSSNVKAAAAVLKTKCMKNELALDLDADHHFSTQPQPNSYNCD